jgi:anion-transporting  ArsA/GET3 family ATPase
MLTAGGANGVVMLLAAMGTGLLDRTLLYVTGKGGVGKTTVAAALGLAAAERGRRTIVCEVAEQERVSRAFARHGVRPDQEIQLAENLWAITIDPEAALHEWLERRLGGGAALRILRGSSAFQHFVAAAPGAKELITIAKVWELAQLARWDARNRSYDLVVVDAPASGHGLAMLSAPRTFGEIARVGPVRRQASKVRDMLSDPTRTGYVAVALPEEMPVNETLELGVRLHDAVALGLDAIIVNGLYPERFSAQEAKTLRAAAADGLPPEASAAVRAALSEHERARTQRTHVRRLRREADAPVYTLPFLFEAEVGLVEYRLLATRLGRSLSRTR